MIVIAFSQSQNSQTAAKALLGVSAGIKDLFDELCGVGADFCRPVDEALRTPLGPLLVRLGHVFFNSGVTPLEVASDRPGGIFNQSDSKGMGQLLSGRQLQRMFWLYQRLVGEKDQTTSDVCQKTPWLRLEQVE